MFSTWTTIKVFLCLCLVMTSFIPSDEDELFCLLGDDYKQRTLESRPGLRKKIFSSLNAEIYTLTCRYTQKKVMFVTVILWVQSVPKELSI